MPVTPSASDPPLQLWLSRVSDNSLQAEQEVLQWLSPTELKRLEEIRHAPRRREYQLSRRLMRHALSRRFRQAESSWRFDDRSGRAPCLENPPAELHLSLSHSGGYLCLAIDAERIGVDIEVGKPERDHLASADFFMQTTERAKLAAAQANGGDYFYRCWCAKEARFKQLDAKAQAHSSMRSIDYETLRNGQDNCRLIEGRGDGFRLALVVGGRRPIEQHFFLEPLRVELDSPA